MNTTQHVLYVSGPYTHEDPQVVQLRVEEALEWGRRIEEAGATAYVPHTAVVLPKPPVGLPEAAKAEWIWQRAMRACRTMLTRCDAIVMVPGWKGSRGARDEHAMAHHLGIPVLESMDEVRAYLDRARVAGEQAAG